MKKSISIFLAVVCVLSLAACSSAYDAEYNDTGFVLTDDRGLTGYILCNKAVYAVTVDEVYAVDEQNNEYAKIRFEDPERFLCDNDKDLPRVYRAESVEDITAQNFNPVAALLYLEGEVSLYIDSFYAEAEYQTGSVPEGTVRTDDSEYTYAIRDTLINDEVKLTESPSVTDMDADYTVHIRLLSADFPGLYYEIVFWRSLDGTNYLLDRGTGYSYLCPYKVTERLWGE